MWEGCREYVLGLKYVFDNFEWSDDGYGSEQDEYCACKCYNVEWEFVFFFYGAVGFEQHSKCTIEFWECSQS